MSGQNDILIQPISTFLSKHTFFRNLVSKAVASWNMRRKDKRRLASMRGTRTLRKEPYLSDFSARLRSGHIFAKRLVGHSIRNTPRGAQYYFLTFADDIGNTLDRNPEVNLAAIKSKVDRAVRAMGLQAILVVEVQPIMNYPRQGHGRALMFHVHGVGWTRKHFDPAKAVKPLNDSRAWSNSFGIKPVAVQRLATVEDVARVACYITKMPAEAKNGMPDHKRPGRLLMMRTTRGYTPDLALRVLEGLSQITIWESVFSVGKSAAKLRSRWKRQLKLWHESRAAYDKKSPAQFDAHVAWVSIRCRHGSKRFKPYRWLDGRARPASIHDLPPLIPARPSRKKEPSRRRRQTLLRNVKGHWKLRDL